jgi:hypothetical protein
MYEYSLFKDKYQGWLFRVCTRYIKLLKSIGDVLENDFYSNDSLNEMMI